VTDPPARRLPMFPLGAVLFPGAVLPLHVFEPRYRQLMTDCLAGERRFGVVLISRGSEVGGGDQRVSVGTEASIEEAAHFDDGRWGIVALGRRRIAVESWLPDDPYPLAEVRPLPVGAAEPDRAAVGAAGAAVRRARVLLSELGQGTAAGDLPGVDEPTGDPEAAVWQLCAAAPLGPLDRQRLLEIGDAAERIAVLTDLVLAVADDCHRLLAGPN
jgi:Lon protease-like protein